MQILLLESVFLTRGDNFGSQVWSVDHTLSGKAFKDSGLDPSLEESLEESAGAGRVMNIS